MPKVLMTGKDGKIISARPVKKNSPPEQYWVMEKNNPKITEAEQAIIYRDRGIARVGADIWRSLGKKVLYYQCNGREYRVNKKTSKGVQPYWKKIIVDFPSYPFKDYSLDEFNEKFVRAK